MANTRVSVLIVTFNSEQHIVDCLRSVRQSTISIFEILLIDNGSSDSTIEKVRKTAPEVKIFLMDENLGYSGGHAFGVKHATGDFLFFLNPDTTVQPDFLSSILECLKDNRVAAVQPLVLLPQGKMINLTGKQTHYLGLDWIKDYKRTIIPKEQEIYSLSGCACCIRRSVFLDAGGFDTEYFMYYEDTDLSWKILLLGKKIVFCPESIVRHEYAFIPEDRGISMERKLFFNERNRLATVLKNYKGRSLIILFPAFLFFELSIFTYFLIKGWGHIKIEGYVSLWKMRAHILQQRTYIQKRRSVDDRILFDHMEKRISFVYFTNFVVACVVNPVLAFYARLACVLI